MFFLFVAAYIGTFFLSPKRKSPKEKVQQNYKLGPLWRASDM